MANVLVTGGTGTLGVHTAEHLRLSGRGARALSRRNLPGLTAGDPLAGDGVREPGVSHLVFMSIEIAEVAAKLGEVVSDAAARVADPGTGVAACQRIHPGVVARHRDVPESRAD